MSDEKTPSILDSAIGLFDDVLDFAIEKGTDVIEFLDFAEDDDEVTVATTASLNGGSVTPVNSSVPSQPATIFGNDTILYIVGGIASVAALALLMR